MVSGDMDADAHGSASKANEEGSKVLIIGAGCSGLALAHGLKKAGIPYVVYESRSNVGPQNRDWNFALHWSAPAFQSLIPSELWARIQSAQVDPHTPTKDIDTLRFHNGRTGELMMGLEINKFYRLRHSKLQALLSEGLDIHWGKTLVDITYPDNGQAVTAIFKDGTQVTGSMLIGADGPRSSVRSHLVGADRAKTTPIDFATTICFTRYSREQALFLRSAPHHPLYQIATHPDGYYSWLGLHDASDAAHPETWSFMHYISYPEPRDYENKKTTAEHVAHQKAMAAHFADPWKSSFEWMPDDSTTAWYGKLNHWDPALPEHKWDNTGGLVTLAGDAAHPMTFQRGQGLNHAVTDSLKLCKAIVDCWNGDDEGFWSRRKTAIDGYEKEMIARASEEVRLGEQNSKMLHDWELVQQSPVFDKSFDDDFFVILGPSSNSKVGTVAGGSGFIAAHVLDILLARGHSVVTTVRSLQKAQAIKKAYPTLGNDRLDFAIVGDIARPDAFDQAVISEPPFEVVIHTTSPYHLQATDVKKEFLDPAIIGTTAILKAIKLSAPTVKRVVLTSSFAAITNLSQTVGKIYSETDWNPITEAEAYDGPANGYRASKTFAERAAWDFVEKEKPNFTLAVCNLPLVLGPVVHYLNSLSAVNTSNQTTRDLMTGAAKSSCPPSRGFLFVDVRDAALAHVLAAEKDEAGGKRFFTVSGRYCNKEIAEIIGEAFPELKANLPQGEALKPGDYPGKGTYGFDNARSKSVLGLTYRSLKDSIVDLVKSLQALETE